MSCRTMQRIRIQHCQRQSYEYLCQRFPTNSATPAASLASQRSGISRVQGQIKAAYSTNRATPKQNTGASGPSAAAIRTAVEREAALRAARLSRAEHREDMQKKKTEKEAQKEEADRAYRKRYNTASRKWLSSIIALPILFVTSYYLFDRLALGNAPKELPKEIRDARTI